MPNFTLDDIEDMDAPRWSHLRRLNEILPLEDFIRASTEGEQIQRGYEAGQQQTGMTLAECWCSRWWTLSFHLLEYPDRTATMHRVIDHKPLKIGDRHLEAMPRVMVVMPDYSQVLGYEVNGEYYIK